MEETLKMRNLLQEFLKKHDGVRYPSILGVREHIFTGRYPQIYFKFLSLFTNVISLDNHHILSSYPLQCFFSCMVYVKPRNEFCDHWTACTC
jgi:hypothetical protein